MKWVLKHWLLITILIIAVAFRLYHIRETMTFLEDEGRDLLIAVRMIETGRPVLLGPQTSTGNMYLGPLYYYLITPALYLAQMDPVGPAVMIALSGVLTTYLLFFLGKKWFSPGAGYLAATLFAVLPFSVAVTRASWNPNLVPLVTVLMLLVYDRLLSDKERLRDWLYYGLLIGTMIQLHYMALIFCGVMSLSLAWQKRHKVKELLRGVAVSIIGFFLILAPFIFFEYRNNWVNTKALTRFMQAKEERNIRYDLPLWLWWDKVSKTSYRLIGNTLIGSDMGKQSSAPVVVLSYLAILTLSAIAHYKKKSWLYIGLVIMLLGCLATLGIYQENIHMHYLEFGIPLIILLLAGLFSQPPPRSLKVLGSLLVITVVIIGVQKTLASITSDSTRQTEKARDVASYIVKQAGNSEYNVVSTQGMYTTPFQYFLAVSEHPPTNDLAKRVFDICAGTPCPIDDETTTLLFLTGPGHPSIANYVAHPQLNSFSQKRRMISNEHVSYGIWVAEIVLE